MRPSVTSSPALPEATVPAPAVSDWHTLARLFPYLWEYKWRVVAALLLHGGRQAGQRRRTRTA
jgi:ATP-binding cassette, subfamily B, heavy metal transporter